MKTIGIENFAQQTLIHSLTHSDEEWEENLS